MNKDHERWERVLEQWVLTSALLGDIERFPAIDGSVATSPGWFSGGTNAWGRLQSHIRVLENAILDNVQSLLVLEDNLALCEDFAHRMKVFLANIPNDWDGLFLGGRGLHANEEISKDVVRLEEFDEVYAYALRRNLMIEIYKSLCSEADHTGVNSYFDYRMQVPYLTSRYKFYASQSSLFRKQKSASSTRESSTEYTNSSGNGINNAPSGQNDLAATNSLHTTVVVMGLYRSGSSCVSGILNHLGVYMGSGFTRPNRANPKGYFEDRKLAKLCRSMFREPILERTHSRAVCAQRLTKWIHQHHNLVPDGFEMVGAKHPILCLLGDELVAACGSNAKFIAIHRKLTDSIESLASLKWGWSEDAAAAAQRKLYDARADFLSRHSHLRIEFDSLLANPTCEIERIINFLEIQVDSQQINKAIAFVDRQNKCEVSSASN